MNLQLLAQGVRGLHHVGQRCLGFRPATGLEATVRVDPQPLRVDHIARTLQQMQHGVHAGHAGRVDVIHTRADFVGVVEIPKAVEQLHGRARGLDGDDVGIHVGDGRQDVVELRVAHVGVDLRLVAHTTRGQPERPHGPVQIVGPVALAQRQAFAGSDEKSLKSREQFYNARIAVAETRKVLTRLFPNLSLNYNVRYDSNSFLVHKDWNEVGLSLSFNLLNLLSAPAQTKLAEAGVALADQRRVQHLVIVVPRHLDGTEYSEVIGHVLRVEQLEAAFAEFGAELACVIVEPIAGNMNFVRAALPFVKRLRELYQRVYVALDKEREELVQINTPLSGLHELQAQALEFLNHAAVQCS